MGEQKQGPQMSASSLDVTVVFRDGHEGPAKADNVGCGWCDTIAMIDGEPARFWTPSDGTMNSLTRVRLAKPFAVYERAARQALR